MLKNTIAIESPHREVQLSNRNRSAINDIRENIIKGIIKLKGKYKYLESIIPNGIKKLIIIIEDTTLIIDSKLKSVEPWV